MVSLSLFRCGACRRAVRFRHPHLHRQRHVRPIAIECALPNSSFVTWVWTQSCLQSFLRMLTGRCQWHGKSRTLGWSRMRPRFNFDRSTPRSIRCVFRWISKSSFFNFRFVRSIYFYFSGGNSSGLPGGCWRWCLGIYCRRQLKMSSMVRCSLALQ